MMKLSEWLSSKKEPVIFVDQDNTLLLLSGAREMNEEGTVYSNIMGHEVGILPRPHVKMFLNECKRMADVYVLTAGATQFQRQVLKAVGLLEMVDGVYGFDSYHQVPQDKNGVLIDNLPQDHLNSVTKLQAMGGGLYLKVADWEGGNPEDNELLESLPRLKKLIQSF